ncbi:hypothetical protein AB4165_06420 [Vibrio cyclitrophicus]|uniref:Uncharacterized protein n=1 Tax=Vibrio ponticus TaxID=265668 RepID=A0A3N3DY98_9VIBR|nr:hypothetical protein [Vibrio ponticus]ROV59138.1 hypothetical protein EGH82_15185 [Vibrio ponticus]
MSKDLENAKQKLSEIEEKLNDIDLDRTSSKKGSKLKDRLVALDLDLTNQKISEIEKLLEDIDPDDVIKSKKGSKLKDR